MVDTWTNMWWNCQLTRPCIGTWPLGNGQLLLFVMCLQTTDCEGLCFNLDSTSVSMWLTEENVWRLPPSASLWTDGFDRSCQSHQWESTYARGMLRAVPSGAHTFGTQRTWMNLSWWQCKQTEEFFSAEKHRPSVAAPGVFLERPYSTQLQGTNARWDVSWTDRWWGTPLLPSLPTKGCHKICKRKDWTELHLALVTQLWNLHEFAWCIMMHRDSWCSLHAFCLVCLQGIARYAETVLIVLRGPPDNFWKQFAMYCSSLRCQKLGHSRSLNASRRLGGTATPHLKSQFSNGSHGCREMPGDAERCREMREVQVGSDGRCWEFYDDEAQTISKPWHPWLIAHSAAATTGETEFAALSSVTTPRQKVPFRRWQMEKNEKNRIKHMCCRESITGYS